MEINNVILLTEGFMLTLLLGYAGIPLLKRLKARQSIREEGPRSHRKKAGTPTMGGIFILVSAILVVCYNQLIDPSVLWLLFLTIGHGLLGFLDDFIKSEKRRNLGLTAKQKIVGQIVLSVLFTWGCVNTLHLPQSISVPFTSWEQPLGLLYYPFALLVIVGTSNAVNLTDGLDGLAAGCSIICLSGYGVYCFLSGYIDLGQCIMILAGSCMGFLFFNYHPAKVFMGDTGSLALGGAIAGIAVLTKSELLLILFGLIFVMEALSVIIQVISFKLTGKRVFKMSPIHHHFELSGWSEVAVVWSFWLFEAAACMLAFLGTIYLGT